MEEERPMVGLTSLEVPEGGRSSFLLGVVLGEVVCGARSSLSTLLVACEVEGEVTLWEHSRQ